MSNMQFSVGQRVIRVMDGYVGVVATTGPGTSVGVRWEGTDVIQMVVPHLLKPG